MHKRSTLRAALAAALLAASVAHAQQSVTYSGMGKEHEVSTESDTGAEPDVALPPAPQPADMVNFQVDHANGFRFSVDSKSLLIVADDVRFTIIATSPEGARNISYEGIRCPSGEMRRYAWGQPDGAWKRTTSNLWQTASAVTSTRQEAALAKDIVCVDNGVRQSVAEILAHLTQRYSSSQ